MDRSAALSLLVFALLATAGPAGATSITFVDLYNPPGHLYEPSDSVSIGVFVDGPVGEAVTEFNFHWSNTSELSLASDSIWLIPGWSVFSYVGGTCDLLDPYGLCVGMYDPSGTGLPLSYQQVATLAFDVIDVGSGEAVVAPLFAPGDYVAGAFGADLTPLFSLYPATIQIVPEPSTFGLIALGLVSMACGARSLRGSRRGSRRC
jgi:hypothetical protein